MAAASAKPPDLPPEFRAPPPSPVAVAAGGRPEPPDEGDELAGFLSRSLRVPELVLPDRIFHRVAWNLPEIDMQSLISPGADRSTAKLLKSAAASLGCFQLVNHGIPSDLIAAAGAAAGEAFQIPPDKKKQASRSPGRSWGFEVDDDEAEESGGEEFFWWRGRRDGELAGIWPLGFKDFSDRIEQLWVEMEKIAGKIEQILLEDDEGDAGSSSARRTGGVADSSVLCLHKHGRNNTGGEGPAGSLKHDVLRMLVSSLACSNALTLHVCGGASKFHVYSKRGCAPFRLKQGAVVFTVGDKTQAWSGGRYVHVIGKPIFHDGEHQDAISLQFLYSHPSSGEAAAAVAAAVASCTSGNNGEKTISLARQVMIAACLTLLYHIISYIYTSM